MALCDFAPKILLLLSVFNALATASTKPNIIVILADDLGWNDVSFHGSNQIPTPNIDALAYNGVILNNHYVQALCTPSRASLLTGKYPIHTGMQHLVILEPEPWGLPLNEKLLPEYLHDAGYATHAIGKWHLGFFRKEYTPTHRGFDSHFGYWNGLQDYYDHTVHATFGPYKGYDMRRNMTVDHTAKGRYSTDLFTEEAVKLIREHNTDRPMFMYLAHLAPHTGNQDNPLQAPDEEVVKFAHIEDPERRVYAAMVSMLDKSIGSVMSALREKHMLENSIVVFLSDNGAQTFGIHANHGSNYPLRGLKGSPWEGGIRGVAAVWSPLLNNTQRVSNQLMHITDWLPTLYAAAGMNVTDLGNIDGVNMWPALTSNQTSPRTEVVVNIDDIANYASLRRGDWKYVIGSVVKGTQDQWYGEEGERDEYDVDRVLSSKTAIALAGVLTDKQLQEKRAADHQPGNNFSVQLLTSEKVEEMRQNSIIHCEKPNTDETSSKTACRPFESPCLFNIREDPCETINLASTRPLVLLSLEESLIQHRKTVVKPRNRPEDPNADPAKWNGVWTTWQDCPKHKKLTDSISPTALVVLIVLCIAFFVVIMVLLLLALKKFSSRTSPNGGAVLSSIFKTFDFDAEGKQSIPDKDHRSPLAGHQQDEVFEQREISRQNSFRSAIRHMD